MLFSDDQELILKFLVLNYPIQRLKKGRHFKRMILADQKSYHLSNKEDLSKAYEYLQRVVSLVFHVSKDVSSEVLRVFLNMSTPVGKFV